MDDSMKDGEELENDLTNATGATGGEGDGQEEDSETQACHRFGDDEFSLTTRQRLFVEEYLLDCNATQAAIRAGYSSYSAKKQGSQLLRNSRVRAAIRKRMQERSERTQISADYVIQRLKEEAEYDGQGASPMARVKALELLGKHLGMFWDRQQTVERAEVVYVEVPPSQRAAMIPGAEGRDCKEPASSQSLEEKDPTT